MRSVSDAHSLFLNSQSSEARVSIEIDFGDSSSIWLTSHTDAATPDGATVISGCLSQVNSISQRLDHDTGRSQLGGFSFTALDLDSRQLSSTIKTKLDAGYGLRGKTVSVYLGGKDDIFADYDLVGTQVINSRTADANTLTFKCRDKSREMQDKIFIVQKTRITSNVGADDTTINVEDTSQIPLVWHGDSYSDYQNTYVAYFWIKDELCAVTSATPTHASSTQFTNVNRGIKGTTAAAHRIGSGNEPPSVTEWVHLSLPRVKLLYAILTGVLYGDGENLPGHWHLGIAATDIRTADFTSIGDDLWDTTDDTVGRRGYLAKSDDVDGKEFVEQEILMLDGLYMPVYGNGEIGLKRKTQVLNDSAYVLAVDDNLIADASDSMLSIHDEKIQNRLLINWDFSVFENEPNRQTLLIDAESISKHGDADLRSFDFSLLHGDTASDSTLLEQFISFRDRFAGPPIKKAVNCTRQCAILEVGDVVRLQSSRIYDPIEGQDADRSMEVVRIQHELVSGRVRLDLFGSSQAADTLNDSSSALFDYTAPDSAYLNGTELSAYLGAFGSVSAGKLTILDGASIAGGADMRDAVFYYDGDIDFGSLETDTITITENVQVRATGYIRVVGTITGAGQAASSGAIGSSVAGGSTVTLSTGTSSLYCRGYTKSIPGAGTIGKHGLDAVSISYDATAGDFTGIPADLRGVVGSAGATSTADPGATTAAGGAAGDPGAGLMFISRGSGFAVNPVAKINLSGTAGANGAQALWAGDPGGSSCSSGLIEGGAGAGGAAGAFIAVVDGALSAAPAVTTARLLLNNGVTPGTVLPASPSALLTPAVAGSGSYFQGIGGGSAYASNHRIIRVHEPVDAEPTPQTYADSPVSVAASEVVNLPLSPAGDLSTLEITVTPPSDTNYLYALCYIRVLGDTEWTRIEAPANDETTYVVARTGITYEIEARPVSLAGDVADAGARTQITVSDITTEAGVQPLTPPNVSGLEVFEQGNDTEFTGGDCKLAWRRTSETEWIALGFESLGQGAGEGALDLFFSEWLVSIYDTSDNLLRQEPVTDNWYLYTYEKNAEDYARINGTPGAYRTFRAEVVIRTRQNQLSVTPAKLAVSNPAPALTSVSVSEGFGQIGITIGKPSDLDFAGLKIWQGTSSGFTRDADSLVYDGNQLSVNLPGLLSGQTYYYRYALYDAFSDTDYTESSEFNATTEASITADEVSGLSNWATRLTPADAAFINSNIEVDGIESTRIASLVAGKIAAGTLSARVAVAGVFTATGTTSALNESGLSAGTWRLDMGPVTDGGDTYVLRFHNGSGSKTFSIDDAGNAAFEGNISASTITGSHVSGATVAGGVIYTSGSHLTAAASAGAGTLYLEDTSDFATSGSGYVVSVANDNDAISWTGKTATTLTDVTGLSNTHAVGASVVSTKGILIRDDENEIYGFGDIGGGTIARLFELGRSSYGANPYVLNIGFNAAQSVGGVAVACSTTSAQASPFFGWNSSTGYGGYFRATGGVGCLGYDAAANGIGVRGWADNASGIGVWGTSTSGYGGEMLGGISPLRLTNSASASAPTHAAKLGSLWVTSAGILYINTNGSTTWQKVGAQ